MTTRVAGCIILWLAGALGVSAEPMVEVKELSFLTGRWGGTVEGFQADEIWSTSASGSLMGVYREMKEGKTTFFEFLTIEQEETGPVLRMQHFKPRMQLLHPEPTVFRLTSHSRGKAVFEGGSKATPVRMTFEQKGPDKLDILLEHKRENGEWTHELFAYTRQQNAE